MAIKTAEQRLHRNPGPRWGYRFLVCASSRLPGFIFRPCLWLGTAVGVCAMPAQRRASRTYLRMALKRRPKFSEVVDHFYAFSDSLIRVLRVARGQTLKMRFAEGFRADFETSTQRPGPVLYGTFHLGDGDLLGYFLTDFGLRVKMVRLQVGNSDETRWMEQQFGESVSFIWVDKPENMLFALRSAIEEGQSLALKCDRIEGARKTETFPSMGQKRTFPFTIYWLSLLFNIPVVFSFGIHRSEWTTGVLAIPSFLPDKGLSRTENLARARAHFSSVLEQVENILKENPYLWFNFEPWESEVPGGQP